MIGNPFEESFRAALKIQPHSPEATCQIHTPFRPPSAEEYGLYDDSEELETVYLFKAPRDSRFGISFGRSRKWTLLQLLQKPDTEGSSHHGRARLVDPEWIDLDILKEWVSTCANENNEACESSHSAVDYDLQRPGFLIDVVEGCLVNTSSIADKSLQYVTLSNPKDSPGNRSYLFTTTDNLAQLQEPKSLLGPNFAAKMSPTFRDAIELVRLLKFRYIWIPTLCIIQDEPSSRTTETAKIGDILVGAIFSIKQLCDLDAMQGIHGIKELTNPQPRDFVQKIYPWGDETLILLGQGLYGCRNEQQPLAGQDVGLVAWALQEAYLSRRQIRFGFNSVEWLSSSCRSSEDIARFCHKNYGRIRPLDSVRRDPYALNGLDGPETYQTHWTDALSIPWFSMSHYFQALTVLTEIDQSAGGEILEDAAGLLSHLGSNSQRTFLCGMPEERLDIALLFTISPRDLFRGAHRRVIGPPSLPGLPWPSWSWAGWIGTVYIGSMMDSSGHWEHFSEADIIPIVEWYASESPSPDAPRRRLETRLWDDAKQQFQHNTLEPLPIGWARQHRDVMFDSPRPISRNEGRPGFDDTIIYTHQSLPSLQFVYPIPMPPNRNESATSTSRTSMTTERFISGMVDRMFLYIAASDYKHWYINQPYKLYDENGQHVGVLQSTGGDDLTGLLGIPTPKFGSVDVNSKANATENIPTDAKARLEVIAISRMYARPESDLPEFMADGKSRYDNANFYEFYNIMWIEWTNGVACRKGIGRVSAEYWEHLQHETIHLVLG
ncbi:hypothetical protein VE02_06621 [Pseudogymnoascus sp. 03VT05]|nr:hypothetical protein VE02_06621 [Pseudogymnoascus sp. 03VT05]